jgi:hypothetical protein
MEEISMNRYGYARKEMDTLSGVRAYVHGENVFAGGYVYHLWWFYTN